MRLHGFEVLLAYLTIFNH